METIFKFFYFTSGKDIIGEARLRLALWNGTQFYAFTAPALRLKFAVSVFNDGSQMDDPIGIKPSHPLQSRTS
eukprot:SAG11_NODE_23930_length_381_cov_0.464539_1_plen_72_part_10